MLQEPFARALKDAHHPCLADARQHLQAKVGQSLGHNAGRARLLKAQFWMAVKIAPGPNQIIN